MMIKRGDDDMAKGKNSRRLQLLYHLDDVREKNCAPCANRGANTRKASMVCLKECPIGKQLADIGNKLNEISEEERAMKERKFILSKEEYLQLRLGGKSRKEIAKEHEITIQSLEYWLKKWGIKDPTEEEIAMAELQPPPVTEPAAEDIEAASVQADTPQQPAQTEQKGIVTKPGVSGVGKVTEYSPPPPAVNESALQFLVLRIPLIDGTWDRSEQRLKIHEELEEFATEVEASNIDCRRAASELFDVAQAFAGLIRRGIAELLVDGSEDDHVRKFFEHHNKLHVEKIMRYAAERGWKMIEA